MGIFLTMLGLHSYYYDPDADSGQYSWVPVFSLAGVIYSAALGITNVPFFVLPEILPPKVISAAIA